MVRRRAGQGRGGGRRRAGDEWLETEKRVVVIHRLHQILEPFMLRRQVQDVEGRLPPKVAPSLAAPPNALCAALSVVAREGAEILSLHLWSSSTSLLQPA